MYSLVRAYGVKNSLNSLWQTQDISGLKLFEIFQLYRELYLELTNSFITGPVYVHLTALDEAYSSSTETLDEIFAADPNLSLPTVTEIPTFEQKKVFYSDGPRHGYSIGVAAPGHPVDSNFSELLKTELVISRPGILPRDLHEYCLITVNGFLYQTDYDTNYLYVPEAGKSLLKSRQNTCGIASFERIGKVTKKQITAADVSLVESTVPMSQRVLIKTPPEFRGKALMLSVGGYLVTPHENVFKQISDDVWILHTEKLDIVSRYFESRNYVDYDSLGLTEFPKDMDKVSLIELESNEVTMKYLTHPQSFFISVDTPKLVTVKHFLRHSNLPNYYKTVANPTCPLFLGRGRQADYWKEEEGTEWAIRVANGYRVNLTTDTVDKGSIKADSGSNTPYRIYENSRAYLMDFIADIPV